MVAIGIVRAYQLLVSPILGQRCRYYPSCSNYAIGALRIHGPFKGMILAVWRILRCHPWSAGGVDEVPPVGQWTSSHLFEVSTTPIGMVHQ